MLGIFIGVLASSFGGTVASSKDFSIVKYSAWGVTPVVIVEDNETGLQYLVTGRGGICLRYDVLQNEIKPYNKTKKMEY